MSAMTNAERAGLADTHEGAGAPDDFDGFDLAPAIEAAPQVSSYIAIIRIVAVLGMGLCMSLGLFLMLFGLRGVLVGVPLFLMVVPFYYGMRFAERLAQREQETSAGQTAEA